MNIDSDGSYSYTALETAAKRLLEGETATETFTYTITDSQSVDEGIDTGQITITITGINDAPTAINDTTNINEDSSKLIDSFKGILKNDTDIDGDNLFIKEVRIGAESSSGDAQTSSAGTELTGTYGKLLVNQDGSYRFTADNADELDAGDRETDTFTYTLTDLTNDDSAEVAIEITGVNDAPILSSINTAQISDQENSELLTSSNLSGQLEATDPDASAVLSYGIYTSSTSNSSSNTANGTYGKIDVNSTTGAYTYTPDKTAINNLKAGQIVTESFSIFVSDGSLTSTQDFDIEITGATDPETSTPSSQASTIDGIDAIIGSLLEETSTTADAFSDFITGNQLTLVASSNLDVIGLKELQQDISQSPSNSEQEEIIMQRFLSRPFQILEDKKGVKLIVPNFKISGWKDDIPSDKSGQIPILVSLEEQPHQNSTVKILLKDFSLSASKNTLNFSKENWNKPQLIWLDLSRSNTTDIQVSVSLETRLQAENGSGETLIERFSFKSPNPNNCTDETCTLKPDPEKGNNQEDRNQNEDPELTTIIEKQSAGFLLLRAALSPFIFLLSAAKYSLAKAFEPWPLKEEWESEQNKAIGNSRAKDYSFEIDSNWKANQNIKSNNSSQDNHQSSEKDFKAGLYGVNPFSQDQIQLSDDLFIHTDPLA